MTTETAQLLLATTIASDVVIVRWPENDIEARYLDRAGVAHLLVVAPDAPSPDIESCVEDWIRLPASDDDIRARLATLQRRGRRHPIRPNLDPYGRLSYGGDDAYLSPLEQQIAQVLVDNFDKTVHEAPLLAVWPDRATPVRLRVHISRLRKQLQPMGLTITSVRGKGYVLHKSR
jgi:DNA-binding response OmpR family regulator